MKVTFRLTTPEDGPTLGSWLNNPEILKWFPMASEREIEDSVRTWQGYAKMEAGVTAVYDGESVGMANIYIQPYQKFVHQCLFAIIVKNSCRGQGVGTQLLGEVIRYAKEKFKIELLHLEVYDGNPAIGLYTKLGFVEYGRHPKFIKQEDGTYIDKIMMQKKL
ncbi:MAG: GNAT family N-acetyltransferase [Verrucomicrobia bacterium]|nr:GNAT family N-acetyltransferase [Verrucomicrobiota bacterium]